MELPRIVVSPFCTYSHTHVTAGIAVSVVYTHITGHGKSVVLMSLTFIRQERVSAFFYLNDIMQGGRPRWRVNMCEGWGLLLHVYMYALKCRRELFTGQVE